MNESFVLTVHHNNKTSDYDAELRPLGYSYKIAVFVNDTEVIFEPDEERNYRAIVPEMAKDKRPIDIALLKAIALQLEETFK